MKTKTRQLIRLLLMALLLITILPFFYPWGRPLITLSHLKTLWETKADLPSHPVSEWGSRQEVIVYRWRDHKGNWNFSTEPPANSKFETIAVDPQANQVQRLESVGKDGGNKAPSARQNSSPAENLEYTAEDISKIIQSADAARRALEKRYQTQQEIIAGEE